MKHFLKRHIKNHWVILLIATNAFFIFLFWLGAPDFLPSFLLIIILFTAMLATAGYFFEKRHKRMMDQALHELLLEPSEANTRAVLQVSPEYLHAFSCDLSALLQQLYNQLSDARLETNRYQEFIESWAHEIKIPLSLLTLVLANHADEMSPYVYKRMDHVRTSIAHDVDHVLYYARLQADHMDYSFKELRLDQCILTTLENFRLTWEEQETELQLELAPMIVVSDEKVLAFILSQLISNALKYTSKTEGFIKLTTYQDENTQEVFLSISDNGPGVPQENIPFIFDKGFTGTQATRQNATGMGLYFVKHYSKALNIALSYQSNPGFKITLKFPKH